MISNKQQNLPIWVAIVTSVLIGQTARADILSEQSKVASIPESKTQESYLEKVQDPITDIPSLNDLNLVTGKSEDLALESQPIITNSSDSSLAQFNAVTSITGVQVNPTEDGLEIILETPDGAPLQSFTSIEDKETITDVLNAVLALPEGDSFFLENPAEGIESVSVTQLDGTTVRVSIIGTATSPTAQVFENDSGLTIGLSLEPSTETELLPEEEIELVVTATRTEEEVDRVPRSVTVITREQIQTQSAANSFDNLNDILGKLVPGFGPPKFIDRSLRGQTLRGRPPLILIDGVVQNPNISQTRELMTIDPSVIERIEVVRGPIATYGGGATGGIINIITLDPTEEKLETTLEVGINSDAVQFDGDTIGESLRFGISGKSGQLDFRFNATYDQNGSLIDADGDTIPAVELDNSRNLNGLLKIGFDIDEEQRLEATYNIFSTEFNPQSIAGGSLPGGKALAVDLNVDYENDPKQTNQVANLVYSNDKIFLDSKLNVQVFYQRTDLDRNFQDLRDTFRDQLGDFAESFRPQATELITNLLTNQIQGFIEPLAGLLPPLPPGIPINLNALVPPGFSLPGLPPGSITLPTIISGMFSSPAELAEFVAQDVVSQVGPTVIPPLVEEAIAAQIPDVADLPFVVVQGNLESFKWGVRSQVETPISDYSKILWGLDFTNEQNNTVDSTIDQTLISEDGTEGFVAPSGNFRPTPAFSLDNLGLFAQAQWDVTEDLLISGGLRYEYINADISSFTGSPFILDNVIRILQGQPLPIIPGGTNTADDVVFNFGIVYEITDEINTFINFAQGFSIPSLEFIAGATSSAFDVTNSDLLEPEKVNNYEIGFRGNLDQVQFTVSAFYNHSDNGQNVNFAEGAIEGLAVVTRDPVRVYGVESTIDWQPDDFWGLGATFTWSEGDFDRFGDDRGFIPLSSLEIAPFKITVYVENQTLPSWSNRLQLLWVGDRNRALNDGTEDFDINSYVTLDYISSLAVGPGELQLGVENILNIQFFPLESQTQIGVTALRRLPAPGRRVSLRYVATF